MISISDFKWSNFLVDGIGIGRITYRRTKEGSTGEERGSAYITGIDIDIVVTVNIIVDTTFDCPTYKVYSLRLFVVFVIIKTVDAPIACIA